MACDARERRRGSGCEAPAVTLSHGTGAAPGRGCGRVRRRFHSRIGSDRSLGKVRKGAGRWRGGELVRFRRGGGAPLRSDAASERFAVAVRFRARSRPCGEEEGISASL
jgi:hypothetical protein